MRTKIIEEVNKHSLVGNLWFCLRHTCACCPTLLFWCFLTVITAAAVPVISVFLPKIVIEKIMAGESLKTVLSVAFILTLAEAVFTGTKVFSEKRVYWSKYKMNTYYLQKTTEKSMRTDYCNQENAWFRKLQTESYEACDGNYSAMTMVYDHMTVLCSNALGFFVYFGILSQLNVLLVLFLILTAVLGFLLNNYVIGWTEKFRKERIGYQQKNGYIIDVSADIQSAKDIRLYRMNDWLGQIFRENMKALSGWYKRYTRKVYGVSVCESTLSVLRDIAAYAYLLYLFMTERIQVADFVLYFGMISGFSVWLSGILGQITALKRCSASADYLRTFLEWKEEYRRKGGLKTGNLSEKSAVIELKNVSYRYSGAQNDTLKEINLKIMPGEHVAVVGLNGAGKTTLVKLLCGLTDPSEGSVTYAGAEVRDYDRDEYYRIFSAVFQQHSLLPVSIAEIVAESDSDSIDLIKVKECLITAGLWEKVLSLPGCIDCRYGKGLNDDGIELSGGEIQKLLLARALYRNAPVMILDEPTAALDPLAESRLYEIYNDIMRDKTAVFISHRLASTRFCDRIVLLDEGRIIEEGSHDELILRNGKYAELFYVQAKYYRDKKGADEYETNANK